MDEKLVQSFDNARPALREAISKMESVSYESLFEATLRSMKATEFGSGNDMPDPNRIEVIDHGDYQGTIVFVVGARGYQPSTYWITLVDYGSCSGCDTIEAIKMDHWGRVPSPEQVDDYMTLALHMFQGMKRISKY